MGLIGEASIGEVYSSGKRVAMGGNLYFEEELTVDVTLSMMGSVITSKDQTGLTSAYLTVKKVFKALNFFSPTPFTSFSSSTRRNPFFLSR